MADQLRLWPFEVDWRNGLQLAVEFRTEIFEPRDGREFRHAARHEPRLTYEYSGWAKRDVAQKLYFTMLALSDRDFIFQSPVYRSTLSVGLAAAGSTFEVAVVPPWLVQDGWVVLKNGSRRLLAQVTDVTGTVVTIDAPSDDAYPVGSSVYLGFEFRLGQQMTLNHVTNQVVTSRCQLNNLVGLEYAPDEGAPYPLYRGKEVFGISPNWSQGIDQTFRPQVEQFDVGHGRVTYEPRLDFIPHVTRAEYLARDIDEALAFLAFFARMKGRRGEFYMPSWLDEFPLAADLVNGSTDFKLVGEHYGEFDINVSQKNIFVRLRDGTWHYRYVDAVAWAAGETTFTVDTAWPADISRDDILYAGWLYTYRFAVDELVLEFLTDEVAQFTTTFQLIYELDASL